MYKAYWSDDILVEVRRNSIEELQMSETEIDRTLTNMRMTKAFEDSLIETRQYGPLISVMTNDPKDRHVLAAAVVSGAKLIVTPNTRDFQRTALAPYDIEVKTPDQFLLDLFDFDPDRVIRVISYYSLRRRSGKSVRAILDQLTKTVPGFSAEVEHYISEVDQLYLDGGLP